MIVAAATVALTSLAVRPYPNMTTTAKDRPFTRRALPVRREEQTRALFRYDRDDRSPGQVTTVQINAALQAAHAIDRNVFGNFIEHLGGVIYEGLWAQALLNPNLERIEPNDTTPPAWTLTGSALWTGDGYRSPSCVRLNRNEGAPPGALAQTIALPAHRILNYTLTLYVRAPQGRSEITVAVQKADGSGQMLAIGNAWVEDAAWKKIMLPLTLLRGALRKGERCRFSIAITAGKQADVDQITLFPDDAIDGMDPDVIRRARAWHIPIVRWPGGNFASGYHWQDGIGPREARPTRRNAAWGGIEPNHFGTDEFMRFCRRVGVQPQLTVNAGDGTPEEAAAWVRYCNGNPKTDPFARRRAANGSPKPYGVKIWEIGNELYGGWQIGHTDPAGNAARFVRFRDAMLRADPTLKLIATGRGEEFTPEGWERCLQWNETLLRAAVANGGPAPDYLSLHPLVPLPSNLQNEPYAAQYESAMAQPAFLDKEMLPQLACLIRAVLGPKAKTRLAPTEWGIIVGGRGWQESPNHDTQAGAVFNALTLNAMLRNSDWVTLANMTAFLHGGGIKRPNGVVFVDPQYWTQALYAGAQPQTPVAVRTTGPGSDVPARGFLPAVADVPDVDVFAALTRNARSLVVFAVNRHRTQARPLCLETAGFAASSLSAVLLTAPSPQARNSIAAPDAVAPHLFPTPPWPAKAGDHWQVTLPPHSLAVFTLHAVL